jgi:small conductance mechanosensitive channel
MDTTGQEGLEPAVDTLRGIYEIVVGSLPLVGIALIVLVVGLLVVRLVASITSRTLRRSHADRVATGLITQLVRLLAITAVVLLALTIAGVPVGPALAGLGLAGLALAFALQSILENFVAGLILMIRKPFGAGDQIRSGDHEGTVEDIDLRVTKIVTYDGELVLIPNVDVYTHPLTNYTRRGVRRTRVTIGVDYRDDHDEAREVILQSMSGLDGVLGSPEPEVLLAELGDSSVDFEVVFWSLPDKRSVRHARHAVLSAAKTAIESAGMSIPWPMRTLVVDGPVALETGPDRREGRKGA